MGCFDKLFNALKKFSHNKAYNKSPIVLLNNMFNALKKLSNNKGHYMKPPTCCSNKLFKHFQNILQQ
jgi:hypothetical protein